jgi:hypothetical protein
MGSGQGDGQEPGGVDPAGQGRHQNLVPSSKESY